MTRASMLRFRGVSLPVFLFAGAGLALAQSVSLPPAAATPISKLVLLADAAPPVGNLAAPIAGMNGEPAALPDAPSTTAVLAGPEATPAMLENPAEAPAQTATPNVAPKLTKYIPSGFTAQPITARDKVALGLRDLYSPLNFIAMIASAGYEHALNGEPNYGTDRGAFGERLGAAAIRESTQGVFTDVVFAPLFHEDPRYYVEGAHYGFFHRVGYSVTRPLITRTDGGRSTINAALLAGYAGSSALSYTYYPQINKNFHDTASTFGGSLGGAALGFFVSEFSDDLLKAVHMRKK